MDLVSIIVRTKDRPEYLKRALQSIYLQTYTNIEAVIVNDGGASLKEEIAGWSEVPEHQLIELEHNQGRSRAANLAFEAARGKFISFLDDDDLLYPEHIETLLRESKGQIAYADALKAIQNNRQSTLGLFLEYSQDHSPQAIQKDNFIPIQCILIPKDFVEGKLFDESLEVLEDWDLLIRLSKKHPFKHVKKITSEYTMSVDRSNSHSLGEAVWEKARQEIKNKHDVRI